MQRHFIWLSLSAFTVLTACGDSLLERGATGAAAGAVAGEVIAEDPGTGAIIGGAGGVLTN
ncbi:MAG: hypothetical protein AAFO80_14270 [Pseudomonadota bacterium]